jgi:hypothetical protein
MAAGAGKQLHAVLPPLHVAQRGREAQRLRHRRHQRKPHRGRDGELLVPAQLVGRHQRSLEPEAHLKIRQLHAILGHLPARIHRLAHGQRDASRIKLRGRGHDRRRAPGAGLRGRIDVLHPGQNPAPHRRPLPRRFRADARPCSARRHRPARRLQFEDEPGVARAIRHVAHAQAEHEHLEDIRAGLHEGGHVVGIDRTPSRRALGRAVADHLPVEPRLIIGIGRDQQPRGARFRRREILPEPVVVVIRLARSGMPDPTGFC